MLSFALLLLAESLALLGAGNPEGGGSYSCKKL